MRLDISLKTLYENAKRSADMLELQDVFSILEESLKETQRGVGPRHEFSPSLALLGSEGALDSLDTMIFLDILDQKLTQRAGQKIVLVSDEAFFQEPSPFKNMQTLADYILTVMPQE